MIIYVCTDSFKNYSNYNERQPFYRDKFTFEKLSGELCLQVHYSQINPELIAKLEPLCVIHSGGSVPYEDYDILQSNVYKQTIKEIDIPQLAICRGFQVLASFFGSKIDYMRKLNETENDPNYSYSSGYYTEFGRCRVNIIKDDFLFSGLSRKINVFQNHKYEIKNIPEDFINLAVSKECKIQIIKHKIKPIYGTQCHPEIKIDDKQEGFKILNNFFDFAKTYRDKI